MNFLETRITKLEAQIEEKEMDISDTNLELFDINGEQVKAKIKIMPTDWAFGLAELPDAEIEIAPIGNWRDIVLESEKILNNGKTIETEKEDYSNVLFLRRNGQISATESLFTMCDFQTDIRRENGLLQNLAHN